MAPFAIAEQLGNVGCSQRFFSSLLSVQHPPKPFCVSFNVDFSQSAVARILPRGPCIAGLLQGPD